MPHALSLRNKARLFSSFTSLIFFDQFTGLSFTLFPPPNVATNVLLRTNHSINLVPELHFKNIFSRADNGPQTILIYTLLYY